MTMMGEPQPRRIKPGTRFKDFYTYPKNNFEEHEEQVLGVSQWIEQAAREYALTNPAKTISPPEDTIVNEALWKYEQVRYFCKELNWLVVQLQGYCSPKKYPQMIATEQWIFLCAAHKTPKECFAIDYMRHTLDFVAIQLNDPKKYPTRTTIKEGSIQKLGNICRRIYRLFAHAYYQHKKVYEEFESRTKLCQRFTLFCIGELVWEYKPGISCHIIQKSKQKLFDLGLPHLPPSHEIRHDLRRKTVHRPLRRRPRIRKECR